MIKMYRVSIWSDEIKERVVNRLTDKSIWFITDNGNENRELLTKNDYCWFNSLKEAIEWKKVKIEFELQLIERKAEYYRDKLEKFCLKYTEK